MAPVSPAAQANQTAAPKCYNNGMKLTVRLFIQKHENRSYTVTVPIFPGVSAYGPTLEECKQEIAEALAKRLSEIEPASLSLFALKPNQSLEKVTVELRPTDRHGKRRRDHVRLTMSLLLTPEDDQILVSVPRLRYPPLSFYITSREELQPTAQLELIQYFHGDTFETLLQYQIARQETLDTLEVEFKPQKTTEKDEELEEESFWALKASGTNLTAQAAEGQLGRAFRRDKEVEQLLQTITSDRRPSIVLVGPSGVGKTAIVHEVARRIRRKECPESLHDRQLWAVSADGLIAGMTYIGQWQERLNEIVREVRKKRHILFVEDVAALAEAGRWSKSDDNMGDFLKPFLQTGDVVMIGASTPERLRRAEQLAPGFIAQFRTLEISATGEADTLSILTALARDLEREGDLRIEPSALEAAVELTNRFLPYRAQPGKAVSLLEQLASAASQRNSSGPRPLVSRKDVVTGFTKQSGLPEFIVADNIPLDLAAVRSHFADRIIGQESAIEAMVDMIAMVKAGLNDPGKPLGSFFFIGPTGVGKTQLAKTLASYLFGNEKRMLRFDMSEYNDPAGVRRLLGAPGSGSEGELTGRVRSQPFCVLLLDEFEKADAQIFDVFLQVLGEGRLTDASGQTTSFQNAIIILTSNLGASAREQRRIGLAASQQPAVGSQQPGDEPTLPTANWSLQTGNYWQRKIEEFFRPEFVNRIDQIVAFTALDERAMRQIARRELGDVLLREGLVRRNVLVEIDENVIDLLLEHGFNPTYGARPLKRAVERLIVLPLARFLASRDRPGADLLRLRREDGAVALSTTSFSNEERSAEVLLEGGGLGKAKRRRMDDRSLTEGFAELRRKLQDWNERDAVAEMQNERRTLLADTNQPTFWDNGEVARAKLARFYFLDRLLKRLQQLSDRTEYLEELSGLVNRQRDPRYRAELATSYETLERDVAFLDVELLCAHLEANHSAVLRLRRVGASADEGTPWLPQLAAVYLRWAKRKGYDIECYILEPLPAEQRMPESLLGRYYPYRWKQLNSDDVDGLVKWVLTLDDGVELAIGLAGTNVYGFLKGEAGVHRRVDKRPSGERIQRLSEVFVAAPGNLDSQSFLELELVQRAQIEESRTQMTKKQLAALPKPAEPEVVRVYQFEGDKSVRDMRTSLKTTNIGAVLEGDLDDFILAYLRDEESKAAWQEER
jgi:ATP-dependent Clp protease ATP-binding subunit ClpA/protein subunit release factor A/predicted RNase H-like HicB family nuclease